MIRELFIRELEKYGADQRLADRLLVYGDKPYLIWLVRKMTDREKVNESLALIASALGLPLSQIRYAYFKAPKRTLDDVCKRKEFAYLVDYLNRVYPFPDLWNALLPVAYNSCRKVCAELLLSSGVTPDAVHHTLNMPVRTVYEVRKRYLADFIQQKGDGNDTEHDR